MKTTIYYTFILIFLISCENYNKDSEREISSTENNNPKTTATETDLFPGIETVQSQHGFTTTYLHLKSATEDNDNLSIIAELDHQQNGKTVNKNLLPTKMILFGNPKMGTPIMQNNRLSALDLPQKMIVWKDENNKVFISYNKPGYIQQRHGLEQKQLFVTMDDALSNLVEKATNH